MRHERGQVALLSLTALATLMMLQAIRVFIPYMVFVVDQSQRVELARNAGIVFLAVGLGGLLVVLAGERQAATGALAVLVAARVVLQLWDEPTGRWLLGALAVIAWGWFMIVMIPRDRGSVSLGLGFALVIDVMIRGVRGTVDLPWMPGLAQDLVTVAIAAGAVAALVVLWRDRWLSQDEPGLWLSVPLIGTGSGIALYLLVAGNLGFAQVVTGASTGSALWLMGAGVTIALLFAIAPPEIAYRPRSATLTRVLAPIVGAIAAVAIIVWDQGADVWFAEVMLPLFGLSVALLTMMTLRGSAIRDRRGRWATSIWLTAGLLLQAAFVFAYFAISGRLLLLLAPLAVLTLGASLAGRNVEAVPAGRRVVAIPVAATLALVFGAWLWVDAGSDVPISHGATNDSVTIVTYNIQEGFSRDNRWSLEATATTIESFNPDLVLIQETTRGWLTMSSVDEVRWLSERLDMPFVFGGVSHDRMWGNAILSRLPMLATHSLVYAETDNLRRGALAVEVETPAGSLWVVSTHLDNPSQAGGVRLAQAQELLDFLEGRQPAIIGGDFNADPESDVVRLMTESGFVDAVAEVGAAAPTSESGRRIDYLFTSSGIHIERATIPDIWTSDHKPVGLTITLAGQ